MGPLAAGQVVILPFPFSDLTRSKMRPVLLLAGIRRRDWIACQITSNPHADPQSIPLSEEDFTQGGLMRLSFICPGKLFTAHKSLITASWGVIGETILERVRNAVIEILTQDRKIHPILPVS